MSIIRVALIGKCKSLSTVPDGLRSITWRETNRVPHRTAAAVVTTAHVEHPVYCLHVFHGLGSLFRSMNSQWEPAVWPEAVAFRRRYLNPLGYFNLFSASETEIISGGGGTFIKTCTCLCSISLCTISNRSLETREMQNKKTL